MHHRVSRSIALVAPLVLALVAAACSQAVGSGSSGGTTGGSPAIAFSSPTNGASVTLPFTIQLTSNVPLASPETGDHHAHLYYDTGTDASDYDIVYGTSWTVTRQLSPGAHTITVALANPDHSLAGPTQSITVMVTGGAGGAGGGSAAPSAAPSYAAPSGPTGPTY